MKANGEDMIVGEFQGQAYLVERSKKINLGIEVKKGIFSGKLSVLLR